MFSALRALPVGPVSPVVRVRAVKDLFWSDGEIWHPHAKAGEEGEIRHKTACGFLVFWDSGEVRQVMDWSEPGNVRLADDEVAVV